MQNTEEKTKSKKKKIIKFSVGITLLICIMLVSFGKPLGVPSWNDLFISCGLSADMSADFTASFVNVGSADACCIRCNDKTLLVDCGSDLSYDKLSAYLKRYGFKKFDAIIISHADLDHIGGAKRVLLDFGADTIYLPKLTENIVAQNSNYFELLSVAKQNSVSVINPKITSEIKIGEMKIKFISPQTEYRKSNDCSLVARIEYGEKSFLFTGDISKRVEEDLIKSKVNLKSDVLKVAHHGSNGSSSENFLRAVGPKIAVVSVGVNDKALPSNNVMARINKYSKNLYRTDKGNSIVVSTNGKDLKVQTMA